MRLLGAMRWLPWRWLVRRAARSQGFMDPLALMARFRRFSQPSEVAEPIELLRAGMVFHARGLINTRVIQHNLDWVWPYWIEQQFNPHSAAFLPRAFSLTHINLTHRNWTAVGQPDCAALPLVDPRGLLTGVEDGWSLDAWILADDDTALYPARLDRVEQWLEADDADLVIITHSEARGLSLESRARVVRDGDRHWLEATYHARADRPGRLAIALRPYNPEGISFVREVRGEPGEGDGDGWRWQVQDDEPGARRDVIHFAERPAAVVGSDYRHGDAALAAARGEGAPPDADTPIRCDTGLVTAVALYDLSNAGERSLALRMPLPAETTQSRPESWAEALQGVARLQVPDEPLTRLYDAALRTLLQHSVEDIYPGPYTYRRFWFRDAAFIIHAMLNVGMVDRSGRALAHFPERQTRATGYFHSQEGEWDSNGQALWILARYHTLTGSLPPGARPAEWIRVIRRGAEWVARKRLPAGTERPEAGLLPAGFSAEHLGPNDFYYWDDDWAVGGLRAAAGLAETEGEAQLAASMRGQADDLQASIDRAQAADEQRLGHAALPASPLRRMDAGAIGSIARGYPLQTVAPDDRRLLATVEYLLDTHQVHGGFFQDMIHSGVNAYLTLHLAQILLRAGDSRGLTLIDAVADLASPTGQWPEAIHPLTRGGCMGDGQHVWAAAEWVAMLRNAFCREEGDQLVLGGGIQPRWLIPGEVIRYGPTPTPWGSVQVSLQPSADGAHRLEWRIDGSDPGGIQVALPGREPLVLAGEARSAQLPESGS